ncbi:MAG: Gfo/Idh/MocA family oxidoreductase [Actinobacteria bacterium]|nr:Gfo/Idh/MocA family oxidoreductase [Actinomycetota bacterium]
MPSALPIIDRPVRIAVVGLGQIAELCLPPYTARDDVHLVGLCDLDEERLTRWKQVFPSAATTTDLDTLLELDADVVDVLVPTPFHGDVVVRVLDAGFHVQVQKPLARSLDEADRMLAAARRNDAVLRVLEDYIFYPPLVRLRDVVQSREIGDAVGIHMKIVATGRGGWDVPMSSYQWQFEQARDGRGMLTFDHGWHQLAIAHWLFGPVRRVFGWVRETQIAADIAPEIVLDAPATFVWEHENGVRAELEVVLAPEMYFRSDYYSGDERVEVTGTRGFVRCNRISAFGIREPSVVVYRDGEMRAYHALDDDPPAAFRASAAHGVDHFRGVNPGRPVLDGETAREVLATLIAGLESSRLGRPVDLA